MSPLTVNTATARSSRLSPKLASWAALILIILVASMGGLRFDSAAPYPFLISALLLGMPHGAVDLWLVTRGTGGRGRATLTRRGLAYLSILGAATALAILAPTWALAGFAVVTAMHFGFADQRDAVIVGGRLCGDDHAGLSMAWSDYLAGFGRGTALLAMAFVIQYEASAAVVVEARRLLGGAPNAIGGVGPLLAAVALAGGALLWTLGTFASSRPTRIAVLALGSVELIIFAALFLTVHTVFAVGLYFLLWHSYRHLLTLAEAGLGRGEGLVKTLARLHWLSLPLLIPTLGALAVAARMMGLHTPRELMVLLLVSFVVLTPAHHALVEWVLPRLSSSRRVVVA